MTILETINGLGFKNTSEDNKSKTDVKPSEKDCNMKDGDQRRKPSEQWAYAF
jgi:hypothetical protein